MGPKAFYDREVLKELNVDPGQRLEIQTRMRSAMIGHLPPREPGDSSQADQEKTPDSARPSRASVFEETDRAGLEAALSLLTAEQKEKFENLRGHEINVQLRQRLRQVLAQGRGKLRSDSTDTEPTEAAPGQRSPRGRGRP